MLLENIIELNLKTLERKNKYIFFSRKIFPKHVVIKKRILLLQLKYGRNREYLIEI